MAKTSWRMSAPNLICIGVDTYDKTEYSGRIWHQYADDPIPYRTTIEVIWIMERLFNEWNFPQNAVIFRSFTDAKNLSATRRKRGAELQMDVNRIQNKDGEKGTFIVHVKYRQNATWQGEVIWAEKNKRQGFRSAMELLHLIGSAFEVPGEMADRDSTFDR